MRTATMDEDGPPQPGRGAEDGRAETVPGVGERPRREGRFAHAGRLAQITRLAHAKRSGWRRLRRESWPASQSEDREAGMATAEYAIATVAAAGFAGLLIAILRSDEVRGLLLGIVRGALAV